MRTYLFVQTTCVHTQFSAMSFSTLRQCFLHPLPAKFEVYMCGELLSSLRLATPTLYATSAQACHQLQQQTKHRTVTFPRHVLSFAKWAGFFFNCQTGLYIIVR